MSPCLSPACGCCQAWDRKLDRLRGALVAAGVPNHLVKAIENPEIDIEPAAPDALTGVIRPPAPLLETANENLPDRQHITADGERTLCGIDMADWTGPAPYDKPWCEECRSLDS